MELGIEYAKKNNADLLLATDPDCDRVGIAVKNTQGEYVLLSGNETGMLLLDYICSRRTQMKTMPEDPVTVKTIVTIDMAERIAAKYGVKTINVLTGFKFIGEQIGFLEKQGKEDSYIFGMEESYGYLSGSYVRDKDGVNAAFLICEMFTYYASQGIGLFEKLTENIWNNIIMDFRQPISYLFPAIIITMAGVLVFKIYKKGKGRIRFSCILFIIYIEILMVHVLSLAKDVEKVKKLRRGGCRELFIGIESGSESVRRKINKLGTIDDIITVSKAILESGIDLKGYFIYGFPGETKEDFQKTYELASKIKEISTNTTGTFRTSVFQFRPYHGTQLYNEIVKSTGIIHECEFNQSISKFEGRSQFNFDFGNYSKEKDEILSQYIIKTQELTKEEK